MNSATYYNTDTYVFMQSTCYSSKRLIKLQFSRQNFQKILK